MYTDTYIDAHNTSGQTEIYRQRHTDRDIQTEIYRDRQTRIDRRGVKIYCGGHKIYCGGQDMYFRAVPGKTKCSPPSRSSRRRPRAAGSGPRHFCHCAAHIVVNADGTDAVGGAQQPSFFFSSPFSLLCRPYDCLVAYSPARHPLLDWPF